MIKRKKIIIFATKKIKYKYENVKSKNVKVPCRKV